MKPVEYNHRGERLAISPASQWRLQVFPGRHITVQAEAIDEPSQTLEIIDIENNSKTYMQSLTISFEQWERMHPVFVGRGI